MIQIIFQQLLPIGNEFNLGSISAFQFKNYLQKIKSMVRGKNKPLEQIRNHTSFISNSTVLSNLNITTQYSKCSQNHISGPLFPNCINPQFHKT